MEPICPTSCCQCRRRAVSKCKKAPMTRLKCDSRHSSPPLRLSASPPRCCSANYTIFSIPTILRFIFRRPNERRMTPYLFFSAWTWRAGCLFFRTISVRSGLSVEKSISSFGKQLDGLDQNDATQIFITRIIFIRILSSTAILRKSESCDMFGTQWRTYLDLPFWGEGVVQLKHSITPFFPSHHQSAVPR